MKNLAFLRGTILKKVKEQDPAIFDVIVIGGGATGLGCALDAASRGFRTILVEKDDFAKGTSSRSTKLIHGGVRYLAQGNISLVKEALRERRLLFKNAPHLVSELALLIPNYSLWTGPYYFAGLKSYDILAGKENLTSSSWLSRKKTRDRIPNLRNKGLKSGILYSDGKFDDARLAITLMRSIIDQEGFALNYVECQQFVKDTKGKIEGIHCIDKINNEILEIRGKVVINATGADSEVLQLEDDQQIELNIQKSQGSHLVVDQRFLGSKTALLIPKTPDGRVLFAIPWYGKALIGTTDVPVNDSEEIPVPSIEELQFILETASEYLEETPKLTDITSVFAGIRPLVTKSGSKAKTSTKNISRGHHISYAESGLISISGGKWTTYRKMAEDVIDFSIEKSGLKKARCLTASLPLHGWTAESEKGVPDHFRAYGCDQIELKEMISAEVTLGEKIHASLEYLKVEVEWACQHEMAVKIEDVLARRTRALFVDAKSALESAPVVAEIMRDVLGQNGEWKEKELADFNKLAQHYIYSSK